MGTLPGDVEEHDALELQLLDLGSEIRTVALESPPHTHTHRSTQTHACTYTYGDTHKHTNTHAHINTHTYTQTATNQSIFCILSIFFTYLY